MCEIIQNWLNAKLGIVFDFKSASFGEILKDGTLIAQLLHSYGLLNNNELKNVSKTKDAVIALKNFKYLQDFLETLGIVCKENDLALISSGQNSPALKLLYQLYLKLNNRNKLQYLVNNDTEESKTNNVRKEAKPGNNYIDLYKGSKMDMIKWYENKYARITSTDTKNLKLNELHYPKDSENSSDFEFQLNCFKNNAQNEHIATDIFLNKPRTFRCEPNNKKAKEYLTYLKQKHNKIMQNKKLCKYMHKILLDDIVTSITKKEENEFKTILTNKLLKQTKYEKQLATKNFEVQNQKDVMKQNRKLENQLLLEKCMEEITEQFFRQEHNITLEEERYRIEQERILELHKRLYQEKLEKVHEENYNTCSKVFSDIVDLALKVTEHKNQFGLDVPLRVWKEWKMLFCSEQPLFDSIENIEEILSEDLDEDNEVLTTELYRQNSLDDQDMLSYLQLNYPWTFEEELSVSSSEIIDVGLNILGFIVHRLFLSKYPFPVTPSIPYLPPITLASCVTGVTDESVLSVLQDVLKQKEIIIIKMTDAINYCLEAYQNETTPEIDAKFEEETKRVKEKKKTDKKEKKPKGKKSKAAKKTDTEIVAMVPKETQTPKIFPDEEIKLTRQAELGKYAYETLNLGLTINNFLLIQMFVEYLKSLKHINGWVLVNYPQNVNEAAIFELILTGKCDIDKSFLDYDITFINDLNSVERDELFRPPSDPYISKRISNLVPNTLPVLENLNLNSFLTSYVHLIKKPQNSSEEEMYKNIEYSTSVQDFYTKLGCNITINYETFDDATIKNLINGIIKDPIFANQIYDSVIQETLKAVKEKEELERIERERQLYEEGKKEKKKKDKTKDKAKGKKKEKLKESSISKKPSAEVVSEKEVQQEMVSQPEVEPTEEKETYISYPIPEDFQKTLATTWEDIEELYINDFKQFFFLRRVHLNLIVPYFNKIDKYMTKLINKPDEKQKFLHEFQVVYNDIDLDLRDDEEFKAELHNKLEEFRSKLWDICFNQMRETEDERVRLIQENWFCEEAYFITNLFISAMQLEIDRCICTLQFLEDYYVMMATQEILETKFYKSTLANFKCTDERDENAAFIEDVFIDIKGNIKNKNPFTSFLNSSLSLAINIINSVYHSSTGNIKRIDTSHINNNTKTAKTKKSKGKSPVTTHVEDSKNLNLLVKEWIVVNESEYLRTKYRLNLIASRGIDELEELLFYGQKLFHGIYERIYDRYYREITSANNACELFGHAIEAGKPVQPQLLFRGAEFDVNDDVLFVDEVTLLPVCLEDRQPETDFTVEQLERLFYIFNDLAPSGSMQRKSFTYVLQDMVTQSTENDRPTLVPLLWIDLETSDISSLVCEMFGNIEYISWKDFIIYIMEFPFPTEAELLEVRRQFHEMDVDQQEFVNSLQYESVQFWFDTDFDVPLERAKTVKKVLGKIFTTNNDCINYSNLLLSFCKDIDPVLGFTKALELCLGRFVCWNENTGKNYIEICRYQNYLKEQEQLCAISTAEFIYDELLHKSIKNDSENTIGTSTSKKRKNRKSIREYESAEDTDLLISEEDLTEEYYGRDSTSLFPSLCYFLPFDVIVNVMVSLLPWHCTTACIEEKSLREHLEIIYESLRNEEFDNNVFAHEFLNNVAVKDLLEKNYKFIIKSPKEIVSYLIEKCPCIYSSSTAISIKG